MSGALKNDRSVDDILSSIREVMSGNLNNSFSSPLTKPMPLSQPSLSSKPSQVLVLTTTLQEDGTVRDLGKQEPKMSNFDASKESPRTQGVSQVLRMDNHNDLKTDAPSEKFAAKTPADFLLSQQTVSESLAALSALSTFPGQPRLDLVNAIDPEQAGDYTVEELMRELLKPMLKEWLDAHLPSLVKWLVTEQIEKMMRQQQSQSVIPTTHQE